MSTRELLRLVNNADVIFSWLEADTKQPHLRTIQSWREDFLRARGGSRTVTEKEKEKEQ